MGSHLSFAEPVCLSMKVESHHQPQKCQANNEYCRDSVLSFLTHLKLSLSGCALSDHPKNFIIMMTGVTLIPLLFTLLPPPWARSCRCHFPAGLVRTSSGLIRCSMVSGGGDHTCGLLVSRSTYLRPVSLTEWPPDSSLLLFLESSLSGSGAGCQECPGQPAPSSPIHYRHGVAATCFICWNTDAVLSTVAPTLLLQSLSNFSSLPYQSICC